MPWTEIFAKIITGPVQVVADYFTKRDEIKSKERLRKVELEDAIHQRKVELIKAGLAADASWELEQIRSSGWKDEWVMIILSIPLILVFIPISQPYVLGGFRALEQTPSWYQWLILLIFTAVYGIRIYRRQQSDT